VALPALIAIGRVFVVTTKTHPMAMRASSIAGHMVSPVLQPLRMTVLQQLASQCCSSAPVAEARSGREEQPSPAPAPRALFGAAATRAAAVGAR
jgi:hypothetical protein